MKINIAKKIVCIWDLSYFYVTTIQDANGTLDECIIEQYEFEYQTKHPTDD
jgi:hypothetical protein